MQAGSPRLPLPALRSPAAAIRLFGRSRRPGGPGSRHRAGRRAWHRGGELTPRGGELAACLVRLAGMLVRDEPTAEESRTGLTLIGRQPPRERDAALRRTPGAGRRRFPAPARRRAGRRGRPTASPRTRCWSESGSSRPWCPLGDPSSDTTRPTSPALITSANAVSIDPSGDRLSCRGLSVRSAHDHPLRGDLDRYARCFTDGQDLTAQRVARKPPTRCEPVRPASR